MKMSEVESLQKRLLPGLPNFTRKGRLMFVSPVGHTLRGIFFLRSSSPRRFYVQVFIQPMFVPEECLVFNVGWRLRSSSGDMWNADDPQLVAELSLRLSREALPFLSRVRSPRDTAEAALSLRKSGDPIVQQAVAYSFARAGDVPEAIKALGPLREQLEESISDWAPKDRQRVELLEIELQMDLSEAQRRLESWEAETKKKLGLAEACKSAVPRTN